MNWGYGVALLAEMDIAAKAEDLADRAIAELEDTRRRYKEFTFAARSHVHGLRARCEAHEIVEDQLIAALKAENANHPLASREAVDQLVDKVHEKTLFSPEVIKRTYPDGKLPKDAVIPPNKVWTIK